MSENTKIEWADHTFNPWTGCTKISPACDHCYAEGWAKRSGVVQWGPHAERRRTTPANWALPRRWNAQAAAFQQQHGRRQRVFCASLADVFDNQVPALWRVDLFELIRATPHLDWLLLTKRIGNVKRMGWPVVEGTSTMLPNIWLGITICNQPEADRDIGELLQVPARVRFLSVEPMLGPVDLGDFMPIECVQPVGNPWRRRTKFGEPDSLIDWVICGGESGANARPMNPEWARNLRDQCEAAGVPFLFKQWGEWLPVEVPSSEECYADDGSERDFDGRIVIQRVESHQDMARIGKKRAGRLLDGRTHDGFPA